ncbi:MAG: serine/threonine-protein kinase, partial [Acidobacteriota bacterium]
MNPSRWRQVEEIFRSASQRAPTERREYLSRACGEDRELRRAVEDLLRSDEAAGDYLERLLVDGIELLGQTAAERQVGTYRLLERIGEGGMGVVYRADRDDDEYRKQVAIKLIRWGMDQPAQVERFRRERQILAELEHPNIARLLDGGTTAAGAPYLVMEYVAGEPIDRYCDRHRLGLAARLELFLTVCSAVQHAHQHLVIHRDLKPGNILVTAEGTVKLLDFGIAKLLRPDAGEPTGTLDRFLTLAYASPEQIRGELVGTASDVYSLGVVLYELLTGRRPIAPEGLGRAEAERRILQIEPPAPSRVVTPIADEVDDAASPEDIAAARGLRPQALRRRLSGDLDVIVLMALRKERDRRFRSVDQLTRDLRRHLGGLPIEARKSSLVYRSVKFLRRNRLALAAAIVLVAALLAAVISLQQTVRTQQEREKAAELASFLVDLFDASDPAIARGEDLTARQVLDRGAARIRDEFGSRPLLQATLLDTVGRVYRKLGLYDQARPLVEQALENRRRLSQSSLDVGQSLRHLGHLDKAQGRYPEAIAAYRESLELTHRQLGESHLETAECLNDLALALQIVGEVDEARELLRRALAIYRSLLGDEDPFVATVSINLALLFESQGDYAAAEPLMRDALAIDLKTFGDLHPNVADDLNSLALLLQQQGQLGPAQDLYQQALTMYRQLLEPDHPQLLASLNNLATVYSDQGELDEARRLLEEALGTFEPMRRQGHPDIAPSLNNLAQVLQYQGRYDEAAALLEEALALRRAAFGDRHFDVAASWHNLAILRFTAGDSTGAEPLFRRALELRRELVGEHHPATAASLTGLAMLHRVRGTHGEAITLQRRALEIQRQAFGAEHPVVARAQSLLGDFLTAAGESQAAEALLRRAIDLQRRLLSPQHHELATTLTRLGTLLTHLGRTDEAARRLGEALEIRRRALPEDHWLIAVTASALGACETARGRFAEA